LVTQVGESGERGKIGKTEGEEVIVPRKNTSDHGVGEKEEQRYTSSRERSDENKMLCWRRQEKNGTMRVMREERAGTDWGG
jgi:hypothetical protein